MFAIIAAILFALAAFIAFGAVSGIAWAGLACAGLACLAVHLVWPVALRR